MKIPSDSSDDEIDDKNIKMEKGGSKNSIKISIPSVVEKGKREIENLKKIHLLEGFIMITKIIKILFLI